MRVNAHHSILSSRNVRNFLIGAAMVSAVTTSLLTSDAGEKRHTSAKKIPPTQSPAPNTAPAAPSPKGSVPETASNLKSSSSNFTSGSPNLSNSATPSASDSPNSAPAPADTPSIPAFILIDWVTDFDEACAQALAENKDIFVVFTSNDSAVWGQRLDTEVFSRPAFGAAISKRFVCVLLDFPKTYALSEKERRKNDAMLKAWGVGTFPTVFLADKNGRPYAVTGYRNIPATDYANHIEALRIIGEQRDQKLAASAVAATNSERVVLLSQALREIDEGLLLRHYSQEINTLRRLDPKDTSGLIGDIEFAPKIVRLRERVFRLIRQKKDYKGALAIVDEFITKNAPTGKALQKTLFLKLPVYVNNEVRNHAAVPALMDAIIAVNPDSEQAKMAEEVRAQALELMKSDGEVKPRP